MTKHVMIIGAGPNQLPAIKMARERGYRVTATDYNPQAEGFALADTYGVISTRDAESNVEFARQLHETHPLDGVMTMASESAMAVSKVAAALGLPGVSVEAAWLATHKVERQKAFRAAGVPAPRFIEAHDLEQALAAAQELGWPVVVKPVDSAGSRGVQKINNADEMADAIREIREISRQPEILVEEFLTGTEHSIEGVVMDGVVYWAAISDRNYDKKEIYPPYFLEDGDTLPSSLSEELKHEVETYSTQAVKALGIEWGPVKGDILISDNGARILEMAARLSGDYFCYETIPLHNGINLLEVVMDLSVGESVSPDQMKPSMNRGVALRYVWPKPGQVTQISGVEAASAQEGVHFVRLEPRWKDLSIGTLLPPMKSMGERVMSVMAVGENRQQAIARVEKAVSTILIQTDGIDQPDTRISE
ncbi:ATP-grasp domain-containing protein [Hahella ganghwensis]|uniref:ATP-grasp domain-containing protein n=1 Tax=Hahella ganghwensis TaxID=286420 RepID=UPI0003692E73|nr:ATP-grasp domain-containing protein [Hahella ganghwensis]